ncbi:hypothetical protein WR164_01540 [Philodulcilactobacillus myokoensis]|uniref:Uncharacterized protein n=1 Tax=Philodulcilactobacillus myokoensis TaxID=2929573 RepID=A0A9W6ERL1_9LACO|nr:hypothetical protein [Philodulcilactobacillus myokoensis]GLB46175.1 hypothetical protein WR164_01540 [Philodulcilactobacillus myokoensis]
MKLKKTYKVIILSISFIVGMTIVSLFNHEKILSNDHFSALIFS